jgi:hypothetical protein
LLKQTGESSVNKVKTKVGETKSSLENIQTNVQNLLRSSIAEIQDLINQTETEFQRTNLDEMNSDAIEQLRRGIENKINAAAMAHEEILESVKNQLDVIQFSRDSDWRISVVWECATKKIAVLGETLHNVATWLQGKKNNLECFNHSFGEKPCIDPPGIKAFRVLLRAFLF